MKSYSNPSFKRDWLKPALNSNVGRHKGAIVPITSYPERLTLALKTSGVSKSQLARHLCTSPQAIAHLFTGHTKSLTAANNAKAAELLRVNSDWLASGKGVMAYTEVADEPLSQFEAELVAAIRCLNERGRAEVTEFIRLKAKAQIKALEKVLHEPSSLTQKSNHGSGR